MKAKTKGGTSLIELLVALVIVGLLTVLALPALARLVKLEGKGKDEEAQTLAITLEKLISEVNGSRAILAPRALRGARRAPILVFLDRNNNVAALSCLREQLILRRLSSAQKTVTEEILGPCSAAIFHDRGRTRRCLRVRLRLGDFVLATTLKLINRPVPPPLAEPLNLPEPIFRPTGPEELERAKERYFQRKVSPEHLLAGIWSTV